MSILFVDSEAIKESGHEKEQEKKKKIVSFSLMCLVRKEKNVFTCYGRKLIRTTYTK